MPLFVPALSLIAFAAWTTYTHEAVINYVAPYARADVSQVASLLSGAHGPRKLFTSGGYVAPFAERLVGSVSVLIGIVATLCGAVLLWRSGLRRHPGARVILLLGVLFPPSLLLRLTAGGQETANRLTAFFYVGVAALGAWALVGRRQTYGGRLTLVIAAVSTIAFCGGIIIGSGPADRLPGPYRVSSGSRSVDPFATASVAWIRTSLGSGNRFGADRWNGLLLGSYGRQHTVNAVDDGVNIAPVFFSRVISPKVVRTLARGQIQYLLVDRRLSTALPADGTYYESGEPSVARPIPLSDLTKFARSPKVQAVYSNGPITVYDVQRLWSPSATPSDTAGPG